MRGILLSLSLLALVQASEPAALKSNDINLASALRLAGVNHLDIEAARASLQSARAQHAEMRRKFFPWLTFGTSYHRTAGNLQDIPGNVTEESKNNYQVGVGVAADLRIGELIYQNLAAKQRSKAAEHQVEAARNCTVAQVTQAYFRLLRAQASLQVSQQSRVLAGDYESQLQAAVKAGVAFEADQLRAQVQTFRHDLMIRKGQEDVERAAATLCEMLRLPNGLGLRGDTGELTPLTYVSAETSMSDLVTTALNHRPELRGREAMLAAAKTEAEGARKGPWYPDLTMRGFVGGFGGGFNSSTGNFDDTADGVIGIGWRVGPGGLFDSQRSATADRMADQEAILVERIRQRITREVLESVAAARSLQDRMVIAQKLLDSAEKAYALTRQRGQQGIGGVLETLRAEEDLSFARLAYFDLITESNIAQTQLLYAIGKSSLKKGS
ncbi:MAG: TolC family protein [Akkermansiaceae bacterium]